MRLAASVLASLLVAVGRADAQSASPQAPPAPVEIPTIIAAPTDVSSAFQKLNTNATVLRSSARHGSAGNTEYGSIVKVQSALKTRVENAPVSDTYARAITLDADAFARANKSSSASTKRAAARPAERDLQAKYDQASKLDATTIGQYGDTVMVTVKTLIKGAEASGYFVLANFWAEKDNQEPDHIFSSPTPCSKALMPGFYYFWVDVPGKPRALIEREVSGTGLPPSETIYLTVPSS